MGATPPTAAREAHFGTTEAVVVAATEVGVGEVVEVVEVDDVVAVVEEVVVDRPAVVRGLTPSPSRHAASRINASAAPTKRCRLRTIRAR